MWLAAITNIQWLLHVSAYISVKKRKLLRYSRQLGSVSIHNNLLRPPVHNLLYALLQHQWRDRTAYMHALLL
jgi:hypothetical protein